MSDLISRSELLEEIKSLSIVLNGKQIFSDDAKDTILRIINEQPTAYDIGKVVEELKTDSSVKLYGSGNSDNYLIPDKTDELCDNIAKAQDDYKRLNAFFGN